MSINFTPDTLAELLSDSLTAILKEANPESSFVIDRNASFTSFGLDSMAMVNYVSELEEKLGIELEPELAFNYPTINALSEYINQVVATANA